MSQGSGLEGVGEPSAVTGHRLAQPWFGARVRLVARQPDVCQIVLVPAAVNSCRPVQIKIAVDDAGEAVTFYSDAFGIRYDVIRRTEKGDVSSLVFGKPGHDDFFLLVLIARGDDVGDRPSGTSTFGLLVDELDAAHRRALTAGGTQLVAPHNPEGMPRCSAVADPSGNCVWLYQK